MCTRPGETHGIPPPSPAGGESIQRRGSEGKPASTENPYDFGIVSTAALAIYMSRLGMAHGAWRLASVAAAVTEVVQPTT